MPSQLRSKTDQSSAFEREIDVPRAGPSSSCIHESAFLASPYASVVLNWDGDVVACNRRAAQAWWLGAPSAAGDLVGTPFSAISALSHNETVDLIRTASATGVVTIPMKNVRSPLNAKGVVLRSCLLESNGLGDYRILLSQDVLRPTVNAITSINREKSKVDRRVRELGYKSQHLEQSLDAARIFTNAASHDLRGPLGSLTGLLKLFTLKFADDLPEKGRAYLEKIGASADRLQELTLCLLDYASASAGEVRLEKVEINKVFDTVREDLSAQLLECSGTMEVSTKSVEIQAQPVLMRTLLSNLCQNAIKYRHPDRPLRISTNARFADNGHIEILVSDNGQGLDPRDTMRIFRPFERLEAGGSGSGIGLATCAEICKRHGWHISATGALGVGATFKVDVPFG